MPRSLIPACCDGKDPVRRPGGRRTAWAPAALLAALVAVPHVAAQPEPGRPQLFFSQDAKGQVAPVRELRLRPNVGAQAFLHIRNEGGPASKFEVGLFVGDKRIGGATSFVPVAKNAAITPVIFGKAAEPKDGKPAPLPLREVGTPLSIRLLDVKGTKLDEVLVGVAAPKEYVAVDAVSFDPRLGEDGKKNVLEVKLSARKDFTGPEARVELVLPSERIPNLVPGQRKQGSYGGVLAPGGALILRAENLKFREGAEPKQGLFYVTIDGYPRAFSFVSSFAGEKTAAQPREVTPRVMRLVHPAFIKPGAKLPVIVEVDNMPSDAYGTLGLYRGWQEGKAPAGLDGALRRFTGDRAEVMLFNAAGPAGALVFDSKVGDHAFVFDTKDLFGERYLAAGMIDQAKEKEREPYLTVLNSKKIPEVGLAGATPRIVEPLLLRDGGPDLTLAVDLPDKAGGKLPELLLGAPLPLKATTADPTGVVKAVFFQGRPLPDGKLPPAVPQVEGEKAVGTPGLWVAQLPAPTTQGSILTVSVQVTNGVGETATKTIKIQLVDPKGTAANPAAPAGPKFATVTGVVREGERATPGVPVQLRDADGKLKAATKTDATGVYKFEKVVPGAYVVSATRSASRTRGQTLMSVPVGVERVANIDVKLLR